MSTTFFKNSNPHPQDWKVRSRSFWTSEAGGLKNECCAGDSRDTASTQIAREIRVKSTQGEAVGQDSVFSPGSGLREYREETTFPTVLCAKSPVGQGGTSVATIVTSALVQALSTLV